MHKKYFLPVISILIIIFFEASIINEDLIEKNLKKAENKYSKMISSIGETGKSPRSIDKDGKLVLVNPADWTSGFFPGCLWYLYEFTKDEKWKEKAELYTKNIEQQMYNGTTHDLGFMLYCSYGNGYRLTENKDYKNVLLQSAKTLITRFNPVIGCIKSWDHNEDVWSFPVIIDNMMNLELLFWAAKETGDSNFYKIAITHANTTMKNHFREDYSTWHVLSYDTTNGKVEKRNTHQGYSDESCWARGEAWALYGFTMCYRETKEERYLKQAENIAKYILNNLSDDTIPYWDYNAPNIPGEVKDASAAAITASALYELSKFSTGSRTYKEAADKILNTLSSSKYLSEEGNNNFLLMHATGNKPAGSEIDVPIIYADYYFLEANLRKFDIEKNN